MASTDSESSVAWLDLSEKNRQEMQEHLQLLTEPGTLDELGIGQVRDTFSNLFFPGTSTLWSRARYLLFVPWIYRQMEVEGTGRRTGRDEARRLQRKLIVALREGGDLDGLIGRQVRDPVAMPDQLIWNGLSTWHVRVKEGGLAKYRRLLEGGDASVFAVLRGQSGEALDAVSGSWWHPRLPPAPNGFLDWTTFRLEPQEASFLFEQLQEHHPESLLARALVDDPVDTMAWDSVWECSELVSRADKGMRSAVEMSRIFAYAIQGAGITYSWLVAAKKAGPDSDLAVGLAEDLSVWRDQCDALGVTREMRRWEKRHKAEFWTLVDERNRGLREGTQAFVDSWMDEGVHPPKKLLQSTTTEELIRNREWSVKRNLARLSNSKALDMAKAQAGTGLLPYRWFQVRRGLNDIARGLEA